MKNSKEMLRKAIAVNNDGLLQEFVCPYCKRFQDANYEYPEDCLLCADNEDCLNAYEELILDAHEESVW